VLKAVNGGVDFTLGRAESLGIVGESGSGKSVTAMSILGLVPTPPGRIAGGRSAQRQDLLAACRRAMRQHRGNRIAYIFQDPLTTLHPLFRVGDQVEEAIRHQPLAMPWRARPSSCWTWCASPTRTAARALSARALGRHAPARRHRHGLGQRPDLIIADEPTTALDVTVQAQILDAAERAAPQTGAASICSSPTTSASSPSSATGSRSCMPAASSRAARPRPSSPGPAIPTRAS
jgi:peptide/nickel transport system permease protein